MRKEGSCLIPIAVVMALLCLAILFSNYFAEARALAAGVAFGASLILLLICRAYEKQLSRKRRRLMDAVFTENASIAAKLINRVSVPCALIDGAGRIVWRNESFRAICNEAYIRRVQPQFSNAAPLVAVPLEYAGGVYQVMSIPIHRGADARSMVFQYWVDRTEAAHYQRLFEEQMPTVALIYVDNYEELSADLQFHRASVIAEVEKLVGEMAAGADGIFRRIENGRYLVVFEARHLAAFEAERFPLLERAHAIDTGTGATVSLSIAVGMADRIALADEGARQAMELALGRGGDQAVVRHGGDYAFYGGRRQVESMQSRVKMRLFSKALRQLFENAGDVFIVGHRRPDLDSIGAALGIATCAKQIGLRTYIVLDEKNAQIERVLELVRSNHAYASMLVSSDQAEKMMRQSGVLVVVDTQRASTVAAPKLLELASRVVVIDHHRRSTEHIENPTLHFLESRASSASELVTEVLQYFDNDLRPPAFVCGTLLAGITVDTKHFAFNVGSRTFEAAGYLRKNGADIGMVKQLFQEDMESFGDCANTVRGADLITGGIAIAVVGEEVRNATLIAAKSADELIGIRGIEAAFVLGKDEGNVNVSGRSLGKVNVQIICERLGGGGNLTMAGAQLGSIDLDEAESLVRAAIEQYQQEVGKT